jgi:hypothetical protein
MRDVSQCYDLAINTATGETQMTIKQATYIQADAAVAAYDSFIFSAVGRPFNSDEADILAALVVVACEVASRDRSVNQFTRDYYRNQAAQFMAAL